VQVIALSGEAFDGQAPTVTAPTQSFVTRRALTANTVLANVMATASDPSGIGSMVLEQSTDGGRSWAQVPSPTIVINGTTAQITATVSQNLSATYQFRASATDLLGNQSAPVAAPSVRMSLTDDSAGTPRFNGSWSAQKNNNETAGTIGNTLHIATAPQPGKSNTATLTFTGSEIALVSSLGPDRGAATISVDGGSPQAVDLYAASLQKATVVGTVSGLSAGTHTVTITVLDATRKNPSSSGTRVDVDAFLVRF
jgi:hypothetical protein